jgi:hypothetical protein
VVESPQLWRARSPSHISQVPPMNHAAHLQICRKAVTIRRVSIGDLIYWPLIYTTLNYKLQPHWFTHSKDHCTCSTHKVFCVFTSRFLVTDLNLVLCLRSYRLAKIDNWTHCFYWLTPRLAAISHQPPSLIFTDWLTELSTNCPGYNVSAWTNQKHSSSIVSCVHVADIT